MNNGYEEAAFIGRLTYALTITGIEVAWRMNRVEGSYILKATHRENTLNRRYSLTTIKGFSIPERIGEAEAEAIGRALRG